jgi:shikimate kinase
MRIVLIGMKGCGKTTVGRLLAATLHVPFIDADTEIERMHQRERGEVLPFRQIFRQHGEEYFQALDTRTLQHIARAFAGKAFVFACGGRTPLQEENQEMLARLGTMLFLRVDRAVLLKRILAQGVPPFFPYQDNPERSLDELLGQREPVYQKLANVTIEVGKETPAEIVQAMLRELGAYDQYYRH